MSKNSHKGRNVALAAVFAVTVAAGVTGATYSGISKEASIDEACAHVTWPSIPAYCLTGATDRVVRTVSVDREPNGFGARFEVAFE